MNLGRYGSREILNLQVLDYTTAKPVVAKIDYANTASQELASSRVFAMGAGARRIAWDGEKTATLTVETQIFTLQHLAMIAGEKIVNGAKDIFKTDHLTVQSDGASGKQVTLTKSPIAGTISAYHLVNGTLADEVQPLGAVSGKIIKLDTESTVKIGDTLEVYYQTKVSNANKLSFTAKGFPKYVRLIGDTLYADELAGEDVPAQMIYYKAKVQPNVTITNSSQGDPSVLTMIFDLFPDKVDNVDTMIDMIFYEDEQ